MRVTDQQGRLGRVEFHNAETWQLVGSIWTNTYRTEAAGVFSVPADLREMVAEVLNDTGRVLARIAVDVGEFDAVVPVVNTVQEWKVYVRVRYPNGSGGWTVQDAEGDIEAVHDAPITSPSPPAFPSPGIVHVGKGGATIHLGKGWRWRLRLAAPGGEEKPVEVPAQNTVVTLYITLQTPPAEPPGEQ